MNDFISFIWDFFRVMSVGLTIAFGGAWIFDQFDSYAPSFYCTACKEIHAGNKFKGNVCPNGKPR